VKKTLPSVVAIILPVVAAFEGFRPHAYLDPVGIPTICYGSTLGVHLGQKKTKTECDVLLSKELENAVSAVDRNVKKPIPETRRAALASFTYNVGEGAFRKSTLLRKLNSGDMVGACNELRKWVYAKGKKLPGLVKRREVERSLCLKT
jgi:lysozyme